MPTLGIRQKPTVPATPVAKIQRPGVIITGSCSDSAFVAANVLICADTLSVEKAIRVWLASHGITVTDLSRVARVDGRRGS
jgi:hypothetical protein